MKNFGRLTPRLAGALILLTAAPQMTLAQGVNGFLRPGGGRSVPAAPAPNVPSAPRQGVPAPQGMRPGAIFGRPGGPSFNNPSANPQPNFNRPVFNPPTYNTATGYNNAPNYGGGRGYSNMPAPNTATGYRSQRGGGPIVTLPDPFEGASGGSDRRMRPGRFAGSGNGASGLSGDPFGAGRGGSDGGSAQALRPVGPAYGDNRNGRSGGTDLRITTPRGTQSVPPAIYQNNYIYNNYNNYYNNDYHRHGSRPTIILNAPPLLGGYYYGSYCDRYVQAVTYPSIYSIYAGFPAYIYSGAQNVITVGQPIYQSYVTPYLPFDTPNYAVTYNQNNYYVAGESRAHDIEEGGAQAREAIKNAYPADSYQAAFADIARAWTDGDLAPLRKHVRDSDTRISVFLNKKYSYSIASGDFVQITRDALDRLHTVSFDLTRLRKAKSGDVTAYGVHVYRTGDSPASGDSGTVPFDQNGTDASGEQQTSPYDRASDPTAGALKTVYVSYTLRHRDGQWYIAETDSSDHDLVPAP